MRLVKLILFFTPLLFSNLLFGQLTIETNKKAKDLIDNLLGDNKDIQISNARISGGQKAYGLFKSNLVKNSFFNDGIILTNGLATNAIGPNDNSRKSTKVNYSSDPDINKIAEYKGCYDTVLFEFDLISQTDEIQFRYFFASEEYPEYVNKNVNDVFIFLVTNSNTKVAENIAILNGNKEIPITVDHINIETNSEYYISNETSNELTSLNQNELIKKEELAKTYQYDGFTKVLVAKAKVIPNVKFYLKLGISDVGDQLYDSAIFLESNSLKSTGEKIKKEKSILDFRESISIDYNINFKVDSAEITGDNSFKQLDEVVSYLINDPLLITKVIGHTDYDGSNSYNKTLSERRANAVKQYFIKKGVKANRISTQGMGEKKPKSELKSKNRRVEIVFSKSNY